jgi:hypothetical protein
MVKKALTRSINTIAALDVVVDKNPVRNLKFHEIARAFVGGANQTESYLLGYPNSKRTTARSAAQKLFRKTFMVELVRAYYLGVDDDVPLTKEGATKIWRKMVETNVLDYMDDEGNTLTVKELRKLDIYVQRSIKKITIKNVKELVTIGGKPLLDDDGERIILVHQHVKIELVDKQRALLDLARAEKWIETHSEGGVNIYVDADTLIQAAQKQEKALKHKPIIEGQLEQLHDQKDD